MGVVEIFKEGILFQQVKLLPEVQKLVKISEIKLRPVVEVQVMYRQTCGSKIKLLSNINVM